MAQLNKPVPPPPGRIPFWRDGRVLGIIAQLLFIIWLLFTIGWFFSNVGGNLEKLGRSQFLCDDGTASYRCAYDFMSGQAQFALAEAPIAYEPSDTYWRALAAAGLNTIKVTFLGIIFSTILGTLTGIARLSANWLIRNLAKAYIDVFRNTPLVLQLIFLYFSVILALPGIQEAVQPFGWPIFLSQRGLNYPWPVTLTPFSGWLLFVAAGLLGAAGVWWGLKRWETTSGRDSYWPVWSLLVLALIPTLGWFVLTNTTHQAFVTAQPVQTVADFAPLVSGRFGQSLDEVNQAIAQKSLTAAQIAEHALKLCVVRDHPAEVNLSAQLNQAGIPYVVERERDLERAVTAYTAGECDLLAATTNELTAVMGQLTGSTLVAVPETPLRWSLPRIEGLNFVGGGRMTAEFAAVLIGLVLNTGAVIAEIVRAGIQSVPKGQTEAARALGLGEIQRLRLVILPQALRVIIPPQTSQYLNLAKNSTLAQAVAFPDFWTTSYTIINQSGRAVQVMLVVMLAYLALSLFISWLLNWYNKRVALVER